MVRSLEEIPTPAKPPRFRALARNNIEVAEELAVCVLAKFHRNVLKKRIAVQRR
jgi:hypothetical protein